MIQITVKFKEESFTMGFATTELVTVVKKRLETNAKVPIPRQRLEIVTADGKRVVLKNEDHLSEYEPYLKNAHLQLQLKDLGSQVAYNALFYIEYCFPPLSTLAFYLGNKALKKTNFYHDLLTACIVFHFGKRILETKFVHLFSTASVPFKVLIRNCFHYWALVGVLLPLEVFHIRKMKLPTKISKGRWSLLILFFIFEFMNFLCHLKLRRMRERKDAHGNKVIVMDRSVPKGMFFDTLISPNYTFEILSWAAFSAFFQSYVSAGFTLLSAGIMTQWAGQKKRRYLQQNDLSEQDKKEVKRRYLTLPYIV